MHQIDRRRALQGAAVLGVAAVCGTSTAPAGHAAGPSAARPTAAAARPVLKVGSKGAAVKELQTKLSAAGFWLGSADSAFGSLTQQAVYAVQKANGLARDGIVGARTWAAVDAGRRPAARHAGALHVEIDKARQLLLVVNGGKVTYALNTSTGSNRRFKAWGRWYNGQTPSGSFTCYRYVPGWYTNALGGLYRPVFFNGGIAVHGSTSIPPTNVSHGCCRLSTAAQDMLLSHGYLALKRHVYVY